MTLDEARMLANVNERAKRLCEDGYTARVLSRRYVQVINPEGTVYTVDTLRETCCCPFFTEHKGRYPCKHVLGWSKLLDDLLLEELMDG